MRAAGGNLADPRKSRSWAASVFIGGMIAGAVLTTGVFSLATGEDSAQSNTSPAGDGTVAVPTPTGTLAAARATNPPPVATPYTPPVAVVAGRSSYVFRGLFVVPGSSSNPVISVDVREAMTVVEFTADVVLDLNAEDIPWSVNLQSDDGVSLVARIAGRPTFLNIHAVEPARLDVTARSMVEVRSSGTTPPRLIVWASSIQDGTSITLHVEVSVSGDLYIAVEPVASDIIIWRPTGEALDLSSTVWEGDALVGLGLRMANDCDLLKSSCEALAFNEVLTGTVSSFPSPMDGTLTCRLDGALQLDGPAIRLLLIEIDQESQPAEGCSPAQGRQVAQGDALIDSRYVRLAAESVDGIPLSLVAASDGTLYAGEMVPLAGCPCR